jgi:biopolymer transport protein ExbD
MSGKSKISIQEDITPNLIPMIDIMFLLLLFLMIASDMGQRELEDVRLPVADVVKEDKPDTDIKEGDRLTINVYHLAQQLVECKVYWDTEIPGVCREEKHWRMGVKGTDYTDMEKLFAFLDKEAEPGRKRTDPKAPRVSERKVMIRADGAAPYRMPQKAMNVCARAGMYKIDVGAAQPEQSGGKKTK